MNKILIANRGEIAARIIRTAKKMRIKTVLIYAPQDAGATYLKEADETVLLPGASLSDTYLNIDAIIATVKATNADAVHPGYGFLSENALFAKACRDNGITFIGPTPEAMEAMGNKIAARTVATKAGVPVTQGITGTVEELLQRYHQIPFPILIKAAAGGGGKGMRVVQTDSEIKEALEATAREAKNYFGDGTVYIEKYIENPRHIEVQVLGDSFGNMIHLYERECTLQRRHQKIIEEAGSPTLTPEVREQICAAAVQLAASIGYQNAGTLEFLVAPDLSFYFLEMNTRIQVEHPVTELTTGIDIVEQQIRIARGKQLTLLQKDVQQKGHAIECRIYAEDPEQQFLPSPGKMSFYKEPYGENIRIDGMLLQSGDIISGDFDPMICKLITYGTDREAARKKMIEALNHYFIYGIKNNSSFLLGLVQHPDFIENNISTKYIDTHLDDLLSHFKNEQEKQNSLTPLSAALVFGFRAKHPEAKNIWQQIGYWRNVPLLELNLSGQTFNLDIKTSTYPFVQFEYAGTLYNAQLENQGDHQYNIQLNDAAYPVTIFEDQPGSYIVRYNGFDFTIWRNDILHIAADAIAPAAAVTSKTGAITAPMPGKVIKVAVEEGAVVKKGDLLLIVEAMKMENNILSPLDGVIRKINVKENDKVTVNIVLVELDVSGK
ncbi:MAG: biotin/lipoyl-binding protein [Niabella sp.]|nr:biotin/lipoyl-binding protein [Niabella sp.]